MVTAAAEVEVTKRKRCQADCSITPSTPCPRNSTCKINYKHNLSFTFRQSDSNQSLTVSATRVNWNLFHWEKGKGRRVHLLLFEHILDILCRPFVHLPSVKVSRGSHQQVKGFFSIFWNVFKKPSDQFKIVNHDVTFKHQVPDRPRKCFSFFVVSKNLFFTFPNDKCWRPLLACWNVSFRARQGFAWQFHKSLSYLELTRQISGFCPW